MKFLGGIIFRIFSNAIALMAASHFVAGFKFTGNFLGLLLTATILTVINMFIRPILKLFLGPFVVLTFGLFLVVINALALYLLDLWSTPLTIQGGYVPLLLATLIIGAVNTVVSLGAKSFYKNN